MDVVEDRELQGENFVENKNVFCKIDDFMYGMDYKKQNYLQMKIYSDYSSAMRLRGREPLDEDDFTHHFFEGGSYDKPVLYGTEKNGFLLGYEVYGIFLPTHFAPASLRGGYRLIKDLVNSDIPTALFITKDLVETIRKMKGWKVLPLQINKDFHGELVRKTLVVNKWDSVKGLARYGFDEYLKPDFQGAKWRLRRISGSIKKIFGKEVNESQEVFADQLLGYETLAKLSGAR